MKRSCLIAAVAVLAIAYSVVSSTAFQDRFNWPASAHRQIEKIVEKRRIAAGGTERCYPGAHPDNLLLTRDAPGNAAKLLADCARGLAPVTGFTETRGGRIERVFRGNVPGYVCELTATHLRYDRHPVGAECALALFETEKDAGIGVMSRVPGG